MISFFRHPVKWVHVCWEPAKWGEPRRDPWNLWDLGIWAFPSDNSSKCIIGKKSSWKWRRDLRVQGREKSETDAMCGGEISLSFPLFPKECHWWYKEVENQKLHYHPKTTCPFPALPGKENWTANFRFNTGLWSSGAPYCQGGRLAAASTNPEFGCLPEKLSNC